jgi:glucosamine 6-phosphate synthetase-like amidotransferase/phosphosugar isomerase protein
MCAICGIGLFKKNVFKDTVNLKFLLRALMGNAMSGGYAASGISIGTEKEITVLRRPLSAAQLLGTDLFHRITNDKMILTKGSSFLSVIGHCRTPTKGDPSNNLNNHPIVMGRVVGIHNGVVVNDDELFQKFRLDRRAQVDTEIIFALINHFLSRGDTSSTYEAIKKTTAILSGSYSCALQDSMNPYNLYFFRGHAPCVIYNYPESGVMLFATGKYMITDAIEKIQISLGKQEEIEYPVNSGLVINLYEGKLSRFKLEKEESFVQRGGNYVWPD